MQARVKGGANCEIHVVTRQLETESRDREATPTSLVTAEDELESRKTTVAKLELTVKREVMDLEGQLKESRSGLKTTQTSLAVASLERDVALSKSASTSASLRQAETNATRLVAEIEECKALLRKLDAERQSLQQTNKAAAQSVVDLRDELKSQRSSRQLKLKL